MTTIHRQAGLWLVAAVMMGGCFEEEDATPPFLESLFQDDLGDPDERNQDCDPYFGGCDILDAGATMDSSVDAGWGDPGAPEPPPCDPYSGECEPQEPLDPPAEPEPEPEPDLEACDPYTGDCEDDSAEPVDSENLDHHEAPEDECDPYIEVCGSSPS